MKIIQLTAENIKKLVAVEIRPDGALVQITGKNGQGKTSVLDSIWWALTGARNIQAAPIRNGANQAKIRLDMGDIIVTRTFKRGVVEGDGFTTKLEVVGNVKGSPQAMLDSLLDSLAFDPLQFARMKPQEQFDALKKYVPDVDFDKTAAANSIDMSNRKDINRKAKEERILAEQIVVPPNTPAAKIDEAALVARLAEAGKHNAEVQLRTQRREQAAETAKAKRARAIELRLEAERAAAELKAKADLHDAEAKATEEKLESAGDIPEPINVEELQAEIKGARIINVAVGMRDTKAIADKRAAALEAQAKTLTAQMDQREEEKRAKIAAAKIPVESITFGDGVVMLNGVPFDQASDAEQLKASCALAMAGNPELRVIRVRDGSLLDEEGLALLAKMAEERDYQVWIERVGSGQVGFELVDGQVSLHDGVTPEQGKLI